MVDDLYGTTQPAAGGSTGKPPLRELRGAHDAGREPVWVIDDDRASAGCLTVRLRVPALAAAPLSAVRTL